MGFPIVYDMTILNKDLFGGHFRAWDQSLDIAGSEWGGSIFFVLKTLESNYCMQHEGILLSSLT